MFVRWLVRRRRSRREANLVQSVRTPAGPRLRQVCYLGTIAGREYEDPYDAQYAACRFWRRWDEYWQWLPTREEIGVRAQIDARMAVKYGYVDSIDEANRGDEWYRRCFWWYATANLDKAGITGDDRAKIEASLAAVVPRPAD